MMRAHARFMLIAAFVAPLPSAAHAQRASYEEIQTFSAVLNLIRLNHVDSVSYAPLVRAAIDGALGAVDPHSRYVRRDIGSQLIAARSGESGTAGIEFDARGSAIIVAAIGPASPADRAGVLAGDRVVAVDGSFTIGLGADEVELLLSGQPGAQRRITVERGDALSAARIELVLKLDRYAWPSVLTPLMLTDGTGYVRLGRFDVRAAVELERALDGLDKRGMSRLVLDLRGNPGGLLTEAVSVAALFLPRDALIMRMMGRKRDANQEYRTRSAGGFQRLPLVLVVDGSSASAAEALAGALQDHGRAIVAGHRTFGKALVQMPFPLPAGDMLWLTIARVHTPNGRMIQRSYDGITPAQYAAAGEALRRGAANAAGAGGGIEPDTWFEARPDLPAWWVRMQQDGLDVAAVQRAVLPVDDDFALWGPPLLQSLRTVLIETHGSAPDMSPEQERAAVRHLSYVSVRVRHGDEEAAAFAVRHDPEIARAAALLDERLSTP